MSPWNPGVYFTGRIIYADSYESKTPQVTNGQLTDLFGTQREFYIEKASYKSVHLNASRLTMLYRGDRNLLFRFDSRHDTVLVMNAGKDTLMAREYRIEDSHEQIMGLPCKKLTMVSDLGTTTYYFSDQYRIDPHGFENHNLESWNLYVRVAGTIPLKIVVDTELYTYTSRVRKIEPMKLRPATFAVPNGYSHQIF